MVDHYSKTIKSIQLLTDATPAQIKRLKNKTAEIEIETGVAGTVVENKMLALAGNGASAKEILESIQELIEKDAAQLRAFTESASQKTTRKNNSAELQSAKSFLKNMIVAFCVVMTFVALVNYLLPTRENNQERFETSSIDYSAIPQSEPKKKKLGPKNYTVIFKEDYGESWPFTVETVIVRCVRTPSGSSTAIVVEADGVKYGVNGPALSFYPSFDPIWRDDPSVPGTKISISSIIKLGFSLCD